MTQRHIHYEAAFEDYVRSRGWPYIPVNEQKKAIFSGARIKSFDFLLYRPGGTAWLVDIKGRKFPYDSKHGKRYWENWVTREDLKSLDQWEGVFGEGFLPVFVFVYWLVDGASAQLPTDIHLFRNQQYTLGWIPSKDYAAHARPRSESWNTVSVPAKTFRKLFQPLDKP